MMSKVSQGIQGEEQNDLDRQAVVIRDKQTEIWAQKKRKREQSWQVGATTWTNYIKYHG